MKQRYPLATIAEYGPDASRATKLVVSVLLNERSTDPSVMRTWTTEDGDVREDPVVAREVADLLQHYQVRDSVRTERIIGCPHEEGIDYPMGRVCPRCPFWTTIDRFTHERIAPPVASLTVDQILDELSRERPAPSAEALESADALREALVAPLLSALEHGVAQPDDASVEDGMRFSYALYLFAKWREPRAYPRVIAWLSLPGESAFAIGGDIATQDGSRILAAVCDGDLGPIVRLAANPDANEYCRGAAIEALGLLAAWAEVPRETVIAHLATLEREGLERVPGQIWVAFASTVADIAAVELRSVAERAFDEDLIDPFDMRRSELNAVPWEDPARALESRRDEWLPIDDVAAATLWWAVREPLRAHTEVERLRSNKVGRNEPCPCGSGKKYKKCCGG